MHKKNLSLLYLSCVTIVCNSQHVFYLVNPLDDILLIKEAYIKGLTKKPDFFESDYTIYERHAEPLIGDSIGGKGTAISSYVTSLTIEIGQKNFYGLNIPAKIPANTRLVLHRDGNQYMFKAQNGVTINLQLTPSSFKESEALVFPELASIEQNKK